jgi:opacity protein-like surface antigen
LNIEYEKSGTRGNGFSSSSQFFTFGGGLGCSYFISNNIAIDATFLKLQTSKQQFNNTTGSLGAQNIRLLYFIR